MGLLLFKEWKNKNFAVLICVVNIDTYNPYTSFLSYSTIFTIVNGLEDWKLWELLSQSTTELS